MAELVERDGKRFRLIPSPEITAQAQAKPANGSPFSRRRLVHLQLACHENGRQAGRATHHSRHPVVLNQIVRIAADDVPTGKRRKAHGSRLQTAPQSSKP